MKMSTTGTDAVPPRDLAGCLEQALRNMRDVNDHLRDRAHVERDTLDMPALARFEAFITRTNERATTIMSALELQHFAARKVRRVCNARGSAAVSGPMSTGLVHEFGA